MRIRTETLCRKFPWRESSQGFGVRSLSMSGVPVYGAVIPDERGREESSRLTSVFKEFPILWPGRRLCLTLRDVDYGRLVVADGRHLSYARFRSISFRLTREGDVNFKFWPEDREGRNFRCPCRAGRAQGHLCALEHFLCCLFLASGRSRGTLW